MNETMLKLKDKQKELDVKRELVQAEMQSHKLALKRLEKEFDGYGEELKFVVLLMDGETRRGLDAKTNVDVQAGV